jgi:hypothetical protein
MGEEGILEHGVTAVVASLELEVSLNEWLYYFSRGPP